MGNIKLIFQAGEEIVRLKINREKEILHISTSKTNYKWVRTQYWRLFDKGKEKFQKMQTDKLQDHLFIGAIEEEMRLQGYKRII